MVDNTPNPGSDIAIERGCICPILDNGHGIGTFWNGQRQFWINQDCPIHGDHANREKDAEKCEV